MTDNSLYEPPKPVFRAGTIPYVIENGHVVMMFMKPSDTTYGGDCFQIAKGRVDEGETNEQAGLREAKEELGLLEPNIELFEHVGLFLGRTNVYVARVRDKEFFGYPSFETAEVAWMTLEQFEATGRELHRPVVRAAHRRIKLIEQKDE